MGTRTDTIDVRWFISALWNEAWSWHMEQNWDEMEAVWPAYGSVSSKGTEILSDNPSFFKYKGFFFFSCLHKNVEHWSSCYLPRRIIRNVLLLSHMHCCTWQVNSLEVLLGFLTLFFAICNLLVIVCCKAKNQMGGMTESSTFYEIMILFHQEWVELFYWKF